ncbi:MAG: citrate/2-methylcitrate synthase [Christensenellaceae bacterium]|nr:citrate/2-methylcitrate synthase [Christensenellaceae bacterium]
MPNQNDIQRFTKKYAVTCEKNDTVSFDLYDEYGVKRGLRDKNGNGVLTGLTNISRIDAFKISDGKKVPCDGHLWYRGYDITDIVKGLKNRRFGFEETAYLLLFGELPSKPELSEFISVISKGRTLPTNFTRDVIMKAPSSDLMNSLTKSVLTLASYDDNVNDLSISNVLRQCLNLISVMPMLSVYGYHAYNHYLKDDSLYIHRPEENISTAENLLTMLRPDKNFTTLEATVLDIALILHMEHGGGNNSTFTTRVVTSSGSDTYSVIAAALCSLKGPKHGGANIKVMQMMDDLRKKVNDISDKDEIEHYLNKIVDKKEFDNKGLIYGMGHAVYSLSDPRARIFKSFVEKLAIEKHREKDFALYTAVEELSPKIIAEKRKIYKGVSANVDFYSGFVYNMLGIPTELYTPLFAVARIVGWCAHRIEELVNADKIIRPSYKSVASTRDYISIEKR